MPEPVFKRDGWDKWEKPDLSAVDVAEAYDQALEDPGFHRELQGQPLEHFQLDMVKAMERAVNNPHGQFLTIRSARQTGKNEMLGTLEDRLLVDRMLDGGTLVHAAPTFKPQIVRAKQRLEKLLKRDPLAHKPGGKERWEAKEGYQFWMGAACVEFYSADKKANVVGGTGDLGLVVDEAHKVDQGKFDEDFAPMTARTASPVIFTGVAAYQNDLLYEYMQKIRTGEAKGESLEFPAALWCEVDPVYALHYEARVKALGASHPVILTQYDLQDLEGGGGLFSSEQKDSLFSGGHEFLNKPREGEIYLAGMDVAGEAEVDEDTLEMEVQDRDSSVLLIARVIFDAYFHRTTYPKVEVVCGRKWTGENLPIVQAQALRELGRWKVRRGLTDARGVGEQLAGVLQRKHPPMRGYKATKESVHEDASYLLALMNHGRITFWQGEDPLHKEAVRQATWTRKKVTGHEFINMDKPKRHQHIDIMKSLSYIARVAKSFRPTKKADI
jgi:hypothetical protein